MVERELPTKIGLDPCSGFDGRTTDACAMRAIRSVKLYCIFINKNAFKNKPAPRARGRLFLASLHISKSI